MSARAAGRHGNASALGAPQAPQANVQFQVPAPCFFAQSAGTASRFALGAQWAFLGDPAAHGHFSAFHFVEEPEAVMLVLGTRHPLTGRLQQVAALRVAKSTLGDVMNGSLSEAFVNQLFRDAEAANSPVRGPMHEEELQALRGRIDNIVTHDVQVVRTAYSMNAACMDFISLDIHELVAATRAIDQGHAGPIPIRHRFVLRATMALGLMAGLAKRLSKYRMEGQDT